MGITAQGVPNIKRGTYQIIHIDGSETVVKNKPTIEAINVAIGSVGLDSVVLSHSPPIIVMFVANANSSHWRKSKHAADMRFLSATMLHRGNGFQ